MRNRYVIAAVPINGSYQYGDLICLGREVAVVLVRRLGMAHFLTCHPMQLVIRHD
jgi:hypothetical protein